jgi:hypothetical protein
VVGVLVTVEQANHLGQHGPFVKVLSDMDDGNTIVDWYTVKSALGFAEELRRAAMSA